ncbi:MAG: DNA/RNA non-specific endonuclease, partial [Saprospiraceae bacterium]|nr:DNA/RNA non-specific endonuclease [Saprospiraceae bacterium]
SLEVYRNQKTVLSNQIKNLEAKIIDWRQMQIIEELKAVGLPSTNYVEHKAMILEYSEEHEQAKWVSHIIVPEIKTGLAYRSNDFRVDPKISTGTAIQEDYFLTDTLPGGKVEYDGYGYDRGHLAPSADFRWSEAALSESYFYSNMSPQSPNFNREKWAELESHLRRYVINNDVPLIVVTIPILNAGLPKLERSVNSLSIPNRYAKAVYDPVNDRAIGFIMENKLLTNLLESYAVSIDELERESGLDVFQNIEESVESNIEKEDWFDNLKNGDRDPIYPLDLPRGSFNTVQAKKKVGQNVSICGHVVASRYSRKGHLWLNLDRQFPNQVFSVFIKKEDLVNFDFDVKQRFTNQSVCVRGKVEDFSDSPSINVKGQNRIKVFVKGDAQ